MRQNGDIGCGKPPRLDGVAMNPVFMGVLPGEGQSVSLGKFKLPTEKLRVIILCGSGAWSVPLTPLIGVPA